MTHRTLSIALALSTILAAHVVHADDAVVLKDGTTIAGRVVSQDPGHPVVVVTATGATETIPWDEVKRITLAPGATMAISPAPIVATLTSPIVPTYAGSASTTPAPTPVVYAPASNAPVATSPALDERSSPPSLEEKPARTMFVAMDLETGVMAPTGGAFDGNTLADRFGPGAPMHLGLGVRSGHFFIGAFASYAVISTEAPHGTVNFVAHDVRAGLSARYHFRPMGVSGPWLGVTMGQEWLTSSYADDPSVVPTTHELTLHGSLFEIGAGVDWHLTPRFTMGPFVSYSFGTFSDATMTVTRGDQTHEDSFDIGKTTTHGWAWMGLRATALL